MKKTAIILGLLVSMVTVTSCTDNSLQEIENEKRIQLIENDEVGDDGNEDDFRENQP